jgi:pyrroloquinoline-quinone synthase
MRVDFTFERRTMTFWTQLESRISKYDLLRHPFYQAWSMGELTREELAAYGQQYLPHVAAFPTYLSALHAQLPDGTLRRRVAENLADEEGIGSPDGRPHSDLWRDFANGMGAQTSAIGAEPIAEVSALTSTFREYASGDTANALAAFYAYESQVPRVAAEKERGLRDMYGADAKTCRYFTLHKTADVHHSQVWRELLDEQLAADPAKAGAALNAAETAAAALWSALDGIERARVAKREVVVQ